MTAPTYAEAIVAVGRMLKPKAGEPRVRGMIKLTGKCAKATTERLSPAGKPEAA